MVFNPRMASDTRYILIRDGDAEWAISASGVAEVLPVAPLHRPAGGPKALAGFMNLGGRALPVVRLASLFGAPERGGDEFYRHVIRLNGGGDAELGLMVDRVTQVDATADRMAPLDGGQSVNGALIGNLVVGERLVPLIDWGRLLLLEEQQRIADLADAAQARLAQLGSGDA